MNRRPLVLVAATAGVLTTAALALPHLPPNPVSESFNESVFKEKGKHFATAADALSRGDAPVHGDRTFALPSWVPKDATDIRVRVRTDGKARLIRFTLGATPLDGPQCAAATPHKVRGPGLNARWWPGDTRKDARPECRDHYQYQVAVRGKRVYAWTDGTPSPGGLIPQQAPPAVRASAPR
ncbi:hypothetical protein ABZ934_10630 [Streptomyces sp. NPDC046557]|uniref:hypothetical protein n=1 Tax=Streptomyces sp. NPDC046557 TaxID=3155372 RepID=UPI00340243D9